MNDCSVHPSLFLSVYINIVPVLGVSATDDRVLEKFPCFCVLVSHAISLFEEKQKLV